ncbi:fibronectin type III-like domain-contianing protein [Streptomyces sp. NPDC053780]|uniref:fibronectin type III-like domain-contianing protein n=1 Tax=unclassified Streptomyces TaxID=2593676 RepID=UPI00342EFD58
MPVAYPFGHGLSCTTFSYDDVDAVVRSDGAEPEVEVTVTVTNTGDRPGTETVQLYVTDPESTVSRPAQELRAFARVALEPGESSLVTLALGRRAFAFWSETLDRWVVEGGHVRPARRRLVPRHPPGDRRRTHRRRHRPPAPVRLPGRGLAVPPRRRPVAPRGGRGPGLRRDPLRPAQRPDDPCDTAAAALPLPRIPPERGADRGRGRTIRRGFAVRPHRLGERRVSRIAVPPCQAARGRSGHWAAGEGLRLLGL